MLTQIKIVMLGVAAMLIALQTASAQPYSKYDEPYRPGYHFSPERYWMNEANGLIYHDGVYHLFYQHNAFNNDWGNMSWGHATSPDLVNWTHKPVAIPGESDVMSFSGSAVYDVENTSGLGIDGDGPLIAAYTGWNIFTARQDQRLAYSNDNGVTWTKYIGNPVLDISSNEFRDPKVVWHEPTQEWVAVITHGGQNRATFWTSPNLINWTFASSFNGSAQGLPPGVSGWEVPDFFELPVDGNTQNTRWVLVITPSQGSPAGGNGVMYFVGSFDGTTFTNEYPGQVLWAEYGRDFDGVMSWEDDPQGRRIWSGIMNSYGANIPTTPWRGMLSIPRELTLTQSPAGVRMRQSPIAELQSLRGVPVALTNQIVASTFDPLDFVALEGDMLEFVVTFEPGDATSFGIIVREGGGDKTLVGYSTTTSEMFVNRSNSGDTSYHPDAGGVQTAPLALDENGQITLHIFVDRSSVEVFGNDGEVVISDLIFPNESSIGVSAFASGGVATIVSFEAWPLEPVWLPEPPLEPGTSIIAHWRMDPVPQYANGNNPKTTDARTGLNEGTETGTLVTWYELDPSEDNLWSDNDLPGTVYASSDETPPLGMFTPGNAGGNASYDSSAIQNTNGALYFPTDRYGNEFSFTGAFSIEMFFKTDGDQSTAGLMQLLLQGETRFRYGIIVNEGGPGNIRFAINDSAGTIPIVDINSVSARNYADGEWHYLFATYDPTTGANGQLSLTIANEDGSVDTATANINGAFAGLPPGGDGNMLIGREDYAFAGGNDGSPRTFIGLIDEVQISRSVLDASLRLGRTSSCQADMDGDGDADGIDIGLFLSAYAAGDQSADFSGDGQVNGIDVGVFLAAYSTGC